MADNVKIYYYSNGSIFTCKRCGSTNMQYVSSQNKNYDRYVCGNCGFLTNGPKRLSFNGTDSQYVVPATGTDVVYESVNVDEPPSGAVQDDGGLSESILKSTDDKISGASVADVGSTLKSAYHSSNIYSDLEIRDRLYKESFRFGLRDTFGVQGTGREYLFFTKPDLHIFQINESLDSGGSIAPNAITNNLTPGLSGSAFWEDLAASRKNTTLLSLQLSRDPSDPFNHLLQNMVKSTMDVPGLSSDAIETPTNMYGVGYSYRGSSEGADDNPTFSLEFKDTKYLDVYTYFKAYEEYETIKHHGLVRPPLYYITNKIIHDQFSVYKFIVADDMETIIYFGKMYGVMPMSLPRDVFSNPTFDDGISYTIEFKAAFYEDMKPEILADFNTLSAKLYNNQLYQINPYNAILDRADMRTAVAAAVIKDRDCAAAKLSPLGYVYKLKWRGGRQL